MIENNTIIKFNYNSVTEEYKKEYYSKFQDKKYLFMGEIKQMPGHCVVCDFESGEMIIGYHTHNFIEVANNEI